jgi:hypothetical protein
MTFVFAFNTFRRISAHRPSWFALPKPRKVRGQEVKHRLKRLVPALVAIVLIISFGQHYLFRDHSGTGIALAPGQYTASAPGKNIASVPGQNYEVCPSYDAADKKYATAGSEYYTAASEKYLKSPWTYHALASGTRSYTVAQYKALPGYATALPPLPSYIATESGTTTAAVIYAPGASAAAPAYQFPDTPLLYFFEGGAYREIALGTISGDEFIGGSSGSPSDPSTYYPEPTFNDGGNAAGISAENDSFGSSGGAATVASDASAGAQNLTLTTDVAGSWGQLTVAGRTYEVAGHNGTSVSIDSGLSGDVSAGALAYVNSTPPSAFLGGSYAQGTANIAITNSSIVLVPWTQIIIGADNYTISSVSGSQSKYSVRLEGGLDVGGDSTTPVYIGNHAGDVTVQYLDISHDLHNTTATIDAGSGWTVKNNNIHDGYALQNGVPVPGEGVALDGSDGEDTIEYNCFSRMGDYAFNIGGSNDVVDYNEIYQTNYAKDPGCGCSGGGKWWGTLNSDIVGNAWIDDGPGGGGPIWLDNGNSGTLISGNYFYMTYANAISDETGYNVEVTNNLFEDDNWGSGRGCGNTNCAGDVNMNTSGGWDIPGSRYENKMLISDNQFINDWGGVGIWESGERSCENSGEGGNGWGSDDSYCAGGFPNTATTSANGKYYFSHIGDSAHGGGLTLAQTATTGSTTLLISGAEAIDDQIGFGSSASTTTSETTNVTSFNGSGTIHASTAGFPRLGQLIVDTTDGTSVVSYAGTTSSTFTGVALKLGSGELSGSIQANDLAYTTTTSVTNVTSFTGSGTINASTVGFPSSGELRVGTSAAWSNAEGSSTGAILSYTGTTATSFTGVSFVRGSGTLAGPILQVQPYKVTAETCYADDCKVTISPSLSATDASSLAGTEVNNAGTCQLFATSAALPSGPLAPNGTSYFDGCQWEARGFSVTGNNFVFNPSLIASAGGKTLPGGATSTTCKAADNYCGSNFMAFQDGGQAPFGTQIVGNAMMSSSSFTGLLNNLNSLASPPNAPANNGEIPFNNVWSNNTYSGPWTWNAYIYGSCSPVPSGMSSSNACDPDFSTWKSAWQQDINSSYSPETP